MAEIKCIECPVCKISKGIPECLIIFLSCIGIVIKFSVSAPIGKENETNAYKPRSYQQNMDKNLVNILNIKKCNMLKYKYIIVDK